MLVFALEGVEPADVDRPRDHGRGRLAGRRPLSIAERRQAREPGQRGQKRTAVGFVKHRVSLKDEQRINGSATLSAMSRSIWLAAGLFVLSSLQSPARSLADLAWLAGDWQMTSGPQGIEEHWSAPAENNLV